MPDDGRGPGEPGAVPGEVAVDAGPERVELEQRLRGDDRGRADHRDDRARIIRLGPAPRPDDRGHRRTHPPEGQSLTRAQKLPELEERGGR